MNLNDVKLPDVQALVAFGKLGVQVLSSRMLSLVGAGGVFALSFYVVYNPSWQGAACVTVTALAVFMPALKAEARKESDAPPHKGP